MGKSFDLLKYIFIAVFALFPALLGIILKEPNFQVDITLIVALIFLFVIGIVAIIKGFTSLVKRNTDLSNDQIIMFVLAGIVNAIFGSTIFLLLLPQNEVLLTAFEVGKGLSILVTVIALLIGVWAFGRKLNG